MLCEIDFISKNHNRTKRNYLARVTDPIYPKYKEQLNNIINMANIMNSNN